MPHTYDLPVTPMQLRDYDRSPPLHGVRGGYERRACPLRMREQWAQRI